MDDYFLSNHMTCICLVYKITLPSMYSHHYSINVYSERFLFAGGDATAGLQNKYKVHSKRKGF